MISYIISVKNVPGSQLLSYRFAVSEKRMLQVRPDLVSIWVLLIPLLHGTQMQIKSQQIYNKSSDMWT